MQDVKTSALSERNFQLTLSLTVIRFGLSVRFPRDLITRVERPIGPCDQAVISTGCSHIGNREKDYQNDERKMSERPNHGPCPVMYEVPHRSMRGTPPQFHLVRRLSQPNDEVTLCV